MYDIYVHGPNIHMYNTCISKWTQHQATRRTRIFPDRSYYAPLHTYNTYVDGLNIRMYNIGIYIYIHIHIYIYIMYLDSQHRPTRRTRLFLDRS